MEFNLKAFTARVRHADAIIGQLSHPKNREMYEALLSQMDIPNEYHSLTLYTTEVALAHLIPTIIFRTRKDNQEVVFNKLEDLANYISHINQLFSDQLNTQT